MLCDNGYLSCVVVIYFDCKLRSNYALSSLIPASLKGPEFPCADGINNPHRMPYRYQHDLQSNNVATHFPAYLVIEQLLPERNV